MGLAIGWALAVLCVLLMVVDGGIAIVLFLQPSAWGWLLADAAFFALAALAEEIAFRGYGFQCLVRAVGPMGAVIMFAALYAILQALLPGSSHASIAVSVALSLAALYGLSQNASLVAELGAQLWLEGQPRPAFRAGRERRQQPIRPWCRAIPWGPSGSPAEATALTAVGLPSRFFWRRCRWSSRLRGIWISFYNAPVIVAGGIPVDLDAAARRQHEAAMGPAEPAARPLVQIVPASAPLQPAHPESIPPDRAAESKTQPE